MKPQTHRAKRFRLGGMLLVLASPAATAQRPVPPPYSAAQHVSGTIRIWGSPQMGDLLARYEEGFHQLQPDVRFDNDLKSTITAVAGVYTGRAEIGLLGREIWPTESQAFASIAGHAPTVVDIATGSYDVPKATFALMVFVPRANPLASLSTEQLDRIFGNTSRHPVRTWGDLGLTGAWEHRPLHLYGFNAENDKAQIFSRLIFKPGERWSAGLHEFDNAGSVDAGEAITRAIQADPDGVGISNVHYATTALKALPLSTAAHAAPIEPSRATVASRLYPLTRAVYMVVDPATLAAHATQPGSAATREFLAFVLSAQGEKAIEQEGNYLELPEDILRGQRQALLPR